MPIKSKDAKMRSGGSGKFPLIPYINFLYRVLEVECGRFKVRLHKPRDVPHFLGHLKLLHIEKKKAENVMLDEVEHDILLKEKFISE